jgi:hypothetical protein
MVMTEGNSGKFSLGDLWQERLFLLYPGQFQKPLTQRERGQLKTLANLLGPETKEIITFALTNWDVIGKTTESWGMSPAYPARPHIGFLLAHCDVALHLMRESIAEKQKKAEAEAQAKAEALKTKPVPKPEHLPMTPEQKAAAYKEFLEQKAAGMWG